MSRGAALRIQVDSDQYAHFNSESRSYSRLEALQGGCALAVFIILTAYLEMCYGFGGSSMNPLETSGGW